MAQLAFENFTACFKKQFLFQKGRGGRRISPYHTDKNSEQHLKNDVWGMMVFIHVGGLYGFTDRQMRKELKISESLYEELKEELPNVINYKYHDQILHRKVVVKIGLVKNSILNTHFIKPEILQTFEANY